MVGPVAFAAVTSRPVKVISPCAAPGDGAILRSGTGSASVATNVSPLFVVGVNVVGDEKPGWKDDVLGNQSGTAR